jgi:hypothetical protein
MFMWRAGTAPAPLHVCCGYNCVPLSPNRSTENVASKTSLKKFPLLAKMSRISRWSMFFTILNAILVSAFGVVAIVWANMSYNSETVANHLSSLQNQLALASLCPASNGVLDLILQHPTLSKLITRPGSEQHFLQPLLSGFQQQPPGHLTQHCHRPDYFH